MNRGYLVCDLFTGFVFSTCSFAPYTLTYYPSTARNRHGISTVFHHTPQISHTSDSGPEGFMQLGDCFTIEPSIEQLHVAENGDVGGGDLWADGWTVVTKVCSSSHQCLSLLPDLTQMLRSIPFRRRERGALSLSTSSSSPKWEPKS